MVKMTNNTGDMVLIPGGTFLLGDTCEEKINKEYFAPQSALRSFYIGKYMVTFREYDFYCDTAGRDKISDRRWGRGNRPALIGYWLDAILYCNWRSQREGLDLAYHQTNDIVSCNFRANGYRLPTEAEWEYAAKGGNVGSKFRFSGSNCCREVSWFTSNSNNMTQEVGQKQPNELGIYDMSGNVYEWCWDWYSDIYCQKDNAMDESSGPLNKPLHVIRGGCYYSDSEYLTTYGRFSSMSAPLGDIGIRLVRTATG